MKQIENADSDFYQYIDDQMMYDFCATHGHKQQTLWGFHSIRDKVMLSQWCLNICSATLLDLQQYLDDA